ncbi:MAG: GMC family oxidoreductase [Hyphomicrobiales bacterium]
MHKANRHYFAAAKEESLPITDDYNGEKPEGAAVYQINTRDGFRCSAARAFLHPARNRPNVTVLTGALVEELAFEGRRVTGVKYRREDKTYNISSAKEVILSAGAVNSLQILQLSGIDPSHILKDVGVKVRFANDHVGGNLQDHLGINYYFKATEPTLNNLLSPWWGKVWMGIRFALTQRGPLSLSVNQCGGFLKSSLELEHPDQQMFFNPVTYTTTPSGTRTVINPDPFPGFIFAFQPPGRQALDASTSSVPTRPKHRRLTPIPW